MIMKCSEMIDPFWFEPTKCITLKESLQLQWLSHNRHNFRLYPRENAQAVADKSAIMGVD